VNRSLARTFTVGSTSSFPSATLPLPTRSGCADLWVHVTQARALARYAAKCAATGAADLGVAAALAQAYCSTVALAAAEEFVQLHGGLGFTWELPAHLHLKRATADSALLGTAGRYRRRLAELVDFRIAGEA